MKRYKTKHLKKRQRIGIGRLSVICICILAVAATISTGVTLSKMVSTATGSASAQVAAFIVEAEEGMPSDLTIDCAEADKTASYTFAVTNTKDGKTAEVSVKYDLIVTLPDALPESLTMTVDGKEGTASEDGLVYTFADIETLPAGQAATQNCTLLFMADTNLVEKDFRVDGIKIDIHTEQVD